MLSQNVERSPVDIGGLIAGRHPDAALGYYDAKAANVRDYCDELCPHELVDEALLGAFTDLLGRAAGAQRDADLDDLLRKAVRAAAAARIKPDEGLDEPCRAVPELLAAAMNDELLDDRALNRHLGTCQRCGALAERFRRAEQAFDRPGTRPAPQNVRSAWLELVRDETSARDAGPQPPAGRALEPAQGTSTAAHTEQPSAEPPLDQAKLTAWLPPAFSAQPVSEGAPRSARDDEPGAPASLEPVEKEATTAMEPETGPEEQPAPEAQPRTEPQPAVETQPPAVQEPIRTRRRSGGLVGAARRWGSRTRQP